MSTPDKLKTALADRYEVLHELGAGGMATVYLAHDVKHDRNVAIKVLRPELAAVLGADRFLQEIKTTANLQHPHILPLFDSGTAGGRVDETTGEDDPSLPSPYLYYVMPYIEGETLRDKMDRETQLSVEEAVKITVDVADALDYAHRHNIIHRDIKPENILLQDGRPVVADFGIALAVSAAGGGRMTETGLSLGTPHYMSPEQATAEKDLTNRSDIYSLGCVLYEMLTGEPPHTGATAQAIIMKIVTDEARPLTDLRKTVPPNVAAATAKALAKLTADRFKSAADFASALNDPGFAVTSLATTATPAERARPANPVRRYGLMALVAVALAAVFLLGRITTPTETPQLMQFAVPLENSLVFGRCCGRAMAISPDGTQLVWIGTFPGFGDAPLLRRTIDRLTFEPIPGTAGASVPFFSPDGRWLGFAKDDVLRKVATGGGPTIPIAEVTGQTNMASWGENGRILVSNDGNLVTVAAGGGELEILAEPPEGVTYRFPHFIPGSKAALFTIVRNQPEESMIAIIDLESGVIDTLGFGTRAEYASGYVLYTGADSTMLAQPFDIEDLTTSGPAVALFGGVQFRGSKGMSEFALSQNGSLVYQSSSGGRDEVLVTMAAGGSRGQELALPQEGNLEDPAFSKDGRRVAFNFPATNDLWIFDREQGTLFRFTVEGSNRFPVWTADGTEIAFASDRSGTWQAYAKAADGGGDARRITETTFRTQPASWFPDGRLLVNAERDDSGWDVGVVTMGDTLVRWLAATRFNERHGELSPDGRWLAYTSDRSGTDEVYVQAVDGAGGSVLISTEGASSPRWSPDGKSLYYAPSEQNIMVAIVAADPNFRVVSRTQFGSVVTDLNYENVNYDVDPSGDGLLLISRADNVGNGIVWIQNWEEMVREMETRR